MERCILKSDKDKAKWYDSEIQKMDYRIRELNIPRPALRALVNLSIYTIEQLQKFSIEELSTLHGIGPSAIMKLNKIL
jgi:DNA integrity scanning protein DisA with diadenylate cyclase activity